MPKQDGAKIDIFTLGVILFLMYFRDYPFSCGAFKHDDLYRFIYFRKADEFWAEWVKKVNKKKGKIPEDFKSLVTQMIDPNPELRPSITDILNHPWMIN